MFGGRQRKRHIKNRWIGGCVVMHLKWGQKSNGGFETNHFKAAAFLYPRRQRRYAVFLCLVHALNLSKKAQAPDKDILILVDRYDENRKA